MSTPSVVFFSALHSSFNESSGKGSGKRGLTMPKPNVGGTYNPDGLEKAKEKPNDGRKECPGGWF